MTELSAFRHQHRNPLTVTCRQFIVAIHIHYFKRKRKLRLHCLQGSNHVMTEMAVLAAIDNQHYRHGRRTLLAVATIELHGDESSGLATPHQQRDVASFFEFVEQLV